MANLLTMICPNCWGSKVECTFCSNTGTVSDEQLTEHFRLSEFLFSSTAKRIGIPNAPNTAQLANIRALAPALEKLRAKIGPIHIDSGLRVPTVNHAVGGVSPSAHEYGIASDNVPINCTKRQAIDAFLTLGIPFDQLIAEYGSWVHIALFSPSGEQRNEKLMIFSAGHYQPLDINDNRIG
jgi:zinc D-Ala-D-Ala carboxypeptidase